MRLIVCLISASCGAVEAAHALKSQRTSERLRWETAYDRLPSTYLPKLPAGVDLVRYRRVFPALTLNCMQEAAPSPPDAAFHGRVGSAFQWAQTLAASCASPAIAIDADVVRAFLNAAAEGWREGGKPAILAPLFAEQEDSLRSLLLAMAGSAAFDAEAIAAPQSLRDALTLSPEQLAGRTHDEKVFWQRHYTRGNPLRPHPLVLLEALYRCVSQAETVSDETHAAMLQLMRAVVERLPIHPQDGVPRTRCEALELAIAEDAGDRWETAYLRLPALYHLEDATGRVPEARAALFPSLALRCLMEGEAHDPDSWRFSEVAQWGTALSAACMAAEVAQETKVFDEHTWKELEQRLHQPAAHFCEAPRCLSHAAAHQVHLRANRLLSTVLQRYQDAGPGADLRALVPEILARAAKEVQTGMNRLGPAWRRGERIRGQKWPHPLGVAESVLRCAAYRLPKEGASELREALQVDALELMRWLFQHFPSVAQASYRIPRCDALERALGDRGYIDAQGPPRFYPQELSSDYWRNTPRPPSP